MMSTHMSERAARSCDGKRRHRSERRATDVAKATQKWSGVAMKSYPCDICKGFHVGSVEPQAEGYMRTSRVQRKQQYGNSSERIDKHRFQRKPL
jgi:hypothetical protein